MSGPGSRGITTFMEVEGTRDPQQLWLSRTLARADLEPLDADQLRYLLTLGVGQRVEAGTLLAGAGADVEQVFVVRDGELQLASREQGGRRVVGLVQRFGVVGDVPLFCGDPWAFDVIASKDSDLAAIGGVDLVSELSRSGDMAVRWAMSIARRLALLQRRHVALLTKDLRGKIATLLLEERQHIDEGGWEVTLTQEVMGALIGARRQSVARVLGELRRDGLLSMRYGRTQLHDLEGLADIIGEPLEHIPCAGSPRDEPVIL